MHVAIYLPSLRGGGAERVMVTLANGIAAKGIRVDLVLASAEGPYLSEVSSGVRIVDLQASRVLLSLLGLIRYLRRERPQAMLSALNHANVIAVVARMLSGMPTRLAVSEHNNVSMAQAGTLSWRGRLMLPLMWWAYRKSDSIVAVSQGVADDLARAIGIPKERIEVIYNPVVTRELLEKAKMPLEHSWLGEGTPPVILGVGRLTQQKNFSALIRSFSIVREQRDCRLIILGEGELRSELERLVRELGVQDSVQLPGFSDNPFAWMSQVSLFVLSSAWEGLPTVLIEAMACGAQVISTDCPSGPSEILEGGKWGEIVPVGSVDAMAAAILRALSDIKSDASISIRGNFFSVDAAVDQYMKVLGLDYKCK